MTRVVCLNNSGARDRLTLHALYRVVRVLPDYLIVIDDKGDSTMFWATRFEAVREEAKVRG